MRLKEFLYLCMIISFGVFIRSPVYYLITQGRQHFEYYFIGWCPILYGVDSFHWLRQGIPLCILGYYPLVVFILCCITFYFGMRKLIGWKSGLLTTLFFSIQIDIWRNTFLGLGDSNGLFLLAGCIAFLLISYSHWFIAGISGSVFLFYYNPKWYVALWHYITVSGPRVQELQAYPDFFMLHLLWLPIGLFLVWGRRKEKLSAILIPLLFFFACTALVVKTYRFNWLFGIIYCVSAGYFFVWLSNYVKSKNVQGFYALCIITFVILTFGRYYPGEPYITTQTYEELGTIGLGEYLGFWSKAHIICGTTGGRCVTGGFPNEVDSALEKAYMTNNASLLLQILKSTTPDYVYIWREEVMSPYIFSMYKEVGLVPVENLSLNAPLKIFIVKNETFI